jgi:hypothetical protein
VAIAIAALLAVAREAPARTRLHCATIRAGETAAAAAKRITGDARNARESWFQILNPAMSQYVLKVHYDGVFTGWNACIVDEPPLATSRPTGSIARADSRFVARGQIVEWGPIVAWGPILVWLGALVLLIALTCRCGAAYFSERERVLQMMERFADRFIREFERPLIQRDVPGRPIQARVRLNPDRLRLDVLLAPHPGRRYPNLTDHRKNVMYDVARVQRLLQDRTFVSSLPYARGRWVVVPFQLTIDKTQAGGR